MQMLMNETAEASHSLRASALSAVIDLACRASQTLEVNLESETVAEQRQVSCINLDDQTSLLR